MEKTYVKGNAVENATSYELLENVDGTYNSLATAEEINFEVSALELPAGSHNLVVVAKADGYEDSDYSNEVVYNVAEEGWVDITNQFELQNNYMISKATTEGAFTSYNGSWVANENYVDISNYSEIKIKMSKTNAAGTNTGIAFYDADKKHVVGYAHTLGDNQYGVMERTFKRVAGTPSSQSIAQEVIEIPETAVFVRTTYWNTASGTANYNSEFGEFYCKAAV